MSGGPTPFAALDGEYRKFQADHEALVRAVRRMLRALDRMYRYTARFSEAEIDAEPDLSWCWLRAGWAVEVYDRRRAQLEALIGGEK